MTDGLATVSNGYLNNQNVCCAVCTGHPHPEPTNTRWSSFLANSPTFWSRWWYATTPFLQQVILISTWKTHQTEMLRFSQSADLIPSEKACYPEYTLDLVLSTDAIIMSTLAEDHSFLDHMCHLKVFNQVINCCFKCHSPLRLWYTHGLSL